jgi:hypothetical protein
MRESTCFAPPALRLAAAVPTASRLAVVGDVHPDPLIDVDLGSVEGRRLAAFIDETARRNLPAWIEKFHFRRSANARDFEGAIRAVPLVVTTLVRSTTSAGTVWFFEAERMRKAGPNEAAGIRESGWIRDSGRLEAVGTEGVVIGGDSQRRTDVLGAFAVGADEAWFLHRIGYEGSEYVVVRVTAFGVTRLIAQSAGGC